MSDAQSDAVLSAYLAQGGTLIDTANNYAHWVEGCQGTESESYLGRWFQKTGNKRKHFQVFKFSNPL